MNYFNITWIKILTGIEKWLKGHKWKDTDKWQVGLISPTIVFVKGPDTQIRNRLESLMEQTPRRNKYLAILFWEKGGVNKLFILE